MYEFKLPLHAGLRRTIWQMAIGTIRTCPKFNDYFTKKREEGKKFKQVVIVVANKLLRTKLNLM